MEQFKELILKHFKNPTNFYVMDDPDYKIDVKSNFCGDSFTLFCKFVCKESPDSDPLNLTFKEVSFYGSGCSFSTASFSIICSLISEGKIKILNEISNSVIEEFIGDVMKSLPFQKKSCLLLSITAFGKLKSILKNRYFLRNDES